MIIVYDLISSQKVPYVSVQALCKIGDFCRYFNFIESLMFENKKAANLLISCIDKEIWNLLV